MQWVLAIPHLFIAYALSVVRALLTLIAFFTVLCTRRIPRPLFDAIAMTFRYEWRTVSYALFLRADYPPFDFQPALSDDGADPHTLVTFTYPAYSPISTHRSACKPADGHRLRQHPVTAPLVRRKGHNVITAADVHLVDIAGAVDGRGVHPQPDNAGGRGAAHRSTR